MVAISSFRRGRPDIIAESPWFEWCTDVYTYLGSGHGAITKRTVLGPECSDAIRPSGRDLDTQQSGYLSRRGGRLFRKASGDYLDLGAGWGGMRFIDGGAPWPAGSPESAEHASILAVTSTGDLRVDSIVAHELVHAMQDEQGVLVLTRSDAGTALVEGQAAASRSSRR